MTWFEWVLASRAERARARSSRHHRGPGQPGPRAGRRRPARRRRRRAGPGRPAQRAGPRARRCRDAGRPGRIRRRVPGRRPGRARRSAATSGHWPAASACTGRIIPAPWPPGSGWPAPAWPRARPRTPSPCASGSWPAGSRPWAPDHPDTLAARACLAAAYDAAGQMGAALQLRQEACAGYERVFGADHPDTLARRADLARAYSAAGQARRGGDPAARHHRPQRAGPVPRRPADPCPAAGAGRHHRGDDAPGDRPAGAERKEVR